MIPELTQSSILRKTIGLVLIISFTLLFRYGDLLAADRTSEGVNPTTTKQLLETEKSMRTYLFSGIAVFGVMERGGADYIAQIGIQSVKPWIAGDIYFGFGFRNVVAPIFSIGLQMRKSGYGVGPFVGIRYMFLKTTRDSYSIGTVEFGVDFTAKSAFNLCMLVGIGSYRPVHTDLVPLSGYLTLRAGYQL